MRSVVREWIRRERDRLVRDELKLAGYVLDYWLVYKTDLIPLRSVAKGSSRNLHNERMSRLRRER